MRHVVIELSDRHYAVLRRRIRAAVFERTERYPGVSVGAIRILSIDKVKRIALPLKERQALNLEVGLTISWTPPMDHPEHSAGYARLDLGLIDRDGEAQYRLQSRTRTASFASLRVPVSYAEETTLSFGKLLLPLPKRGYVAATVVPDEMPEFGPKPEIWQS